MHAIRISTSLFFKLSQLQSLKGVNIVGFGCKVVCDGVTRFENRFIWYNDASKVLSVYLLPYALLYFPSFSLKIDQLVFILCSLLLALFLKIFTAFTVQYTDPCSFWYSSVTAPRIGTLIHIFARNSQKDLWTSE